MSKEMISVPRELLELCAQCLDNSGYVVPHDQLRALLAKPAEQRQSEPVAHVYTMEALVPGGGVRYHAELYRPLPSGTKLYTRPSEQPAPVAVVLPEPRQIRGENEAYRVWHSQGWNACLEEVARLKPPQQ